MSWKTPKGVRWLKGAEAELFRNAAGDMSDEIADGDEGYVSGIPCFDNMEEIEKLAAIHRVLYALTTDTGRRVLKRTAITEGTVAAVFQFIIDRLHVEIDFSELEDCDIHDWRSMVHDASVECKKRRVPSIDSSDIEDWEFLVHALSDRILFDQDYLGEFTMDSSPETALQLLLIMGVSQDYFIKIVRVPRNATVGKLRRKIHRLAAIEE